jgi:DNA phosphorothioation-dependent restriction protein DptG
MFNAVQTLRELNAAPTPEAHNELLVMALQNLSQTPDLSHLATKDDLKDIIKNMATKADIKDMVTKADIKDMATKADIKDMATKADIKDMVTKADIKDMATKDELKAGLALVKAELKVWIVGAAAVGSLGPSLVGLIAKAMHLS